MGISFSFRLCGGANLCMTLSATFSVAFLSFPFGYVFSISCIQSLNMVAFVCYELDYVGGGKERRFASEVDGGEGKRLGTGTGTGTGIGWM